MWCFLQYATLLHIELHLICSVVCYTLPCHALFKPDMHHTCCASCHVVVVVVYFVVCFFPGYFSRQLRFRSRVVRIRSTTSVYLLHGLVLLPCGISGKMTIPSKPILSLLASCSLYCYAAIPTTCYIMPPLLPCQASNPPFLANRCLAMLPLCSAPLIALLVAGEGGVCSLLEHEYFVGISQYLLFNYLMHLYTW